MDSKFDKKLEDVYKTLMTEQGTKTPEEIVDRLAGALHKNVEKLPLNAKLKAVLDGDGDIEIADRQQTIKDRKSDILNKALDKQEAELDEVEADLND